MKTIEWWNSKIQKKEAIKSVNRVLISGSISTGHTTNILEKKLQSFLSVKHAIAVSSGSMATLLAFMALDIKSGDEIIIPSIGWISVINACKIIGAKPVIADTCKNKKIISFDSAKKAISKKTKCIFLINMNGRKIELESFKKICDKKKIYLIEDSAQALGVKYKKKFCGTNSTLGIFSMSITKLLTSGQGGFLVTNNSNLAKKIYYMRRHGFSDIKNIRNWNKYGGNFKISDMQSALALTQLKVIKKKFKQNTKNFKIISQKLSSYKKFIEPSCININKGEIPLYNEFKALRIPQLTKFLKQKKIETRLVSPTFEKVSYMPIEISKSGLKNAIIYDKKYFYLPSGPDLKISEINRFVDEIKKFYDQE